MARARPSQLRYRLLLTFLALVIVVGLGTLYAIERTLARDLMTSLDLRLTNAGKGVASWLTIAGHPDRLAPRLAAVTTTRITIIGADGLVQADSLEPSMIGRPIGDAVEVAQARRGLIGRALRPLKEGDPNQYMVAVPAELGRVIRVAVPIDDIEEPRDRMRYRLLVGFGLGFIGAVFLSWIFTRAVAKPLQSLTRTAERLAAGDYDTKSPEDAKAAGGEISVLARTMMHMAGEVKSRVGELTTQRDLLSGVVSGLVEGIVVLDHDGKIALVNEAAKPLVGDALPAPLLPLVERAQKGEQVEQELELVGRTVRASARPLGSSGAILVLYDVTRMRALEAVRREFLSNAAHELRTPVTSISGYAETLLAGGVDSETSREFVTTIHRNAQRISAVVTDLLVLDQLGSRASTTVTDRVSVRLDQVVLDAARTARGVTPTARIDVEVSPELHVLGTRDGLDHIVQNLIDNAIKYGGGTPVTVRATRHKISRGRSDAWEEVDSYGRRDPRHEIDRVRLSIADAGPGIPAGHEERIFERFYRIDSGRARDQGGSGLGLAIVKSQVEALGGRVWVENAKPGARFVIELDAA